MSAELRKVARAAAKADSARERLHAEIREAVRTASLRAVASAAGLSHEQIRRIAK